MTRALNIVLVDALTKLAAGEFEDIMTVQVNTQKKRNALPVLLQTVKLKANQYDFQFTKTIGFIRNKIQVSEEFRLAVARQYENSALYGKEIFNVAILRERVK